MKYAITLLVLIFLSAFAGILPVAGNAPAAQGENAAKTPGQPTWEIPIAAGVWYPSDGVVPENPMRYYRIRCWPGCHTGSSLGKYPHKTLNDKPIWPTTTVNMHTTESSGHE